MAGEGHNSGEMTPDQRNAKRMRHVRELLDLNEELKPLFERRKQLRGEAKADGFKLSEIDAAIRLMTMEDTSIFIDEIKELIAIAQAFNALPPGEQGDLFPDLRPLDERAFADGKVAGLAGKNPEPPYGADSEPGQRWMEGWHDGQRLKREEMQADMERRNAANRDELIKGADNDDADPFAEAAE